MKRFLPSLLSLGALGALLPGCGYYTNIPAQITLMGTTPGRVTYEPDKTLKIEDPLVTLRADPGRIGATFNSMKVSYFDAAGKPLTADLPTMNLGLTFHVDSSNFSSNPIDPTKPMVQADTGRTLYTGLSVFTLPILTRLVEQYGSKASANAAGVFAQVIIAGADDANFPIEQTFFVSIIFSGVPTN